MSSDDFSRVKLMSLLNDEGADYINANYIPVRDRAWPQHPINIKSSHYHIWGILHVITYNQSHRPDYGFVIVCVCGCV